MGEHPSMEREHGKRSYVSRDTQTTGKGQSDLKRWLAKRYTALEFIIKAAFPIVVHHVGKLSTMYLYRFSYPMQRLESLSLPWEQSSLLTRTQCFLHKNLLG